MSDAHDQVDEFPVFFEKEYRSVVGAVMRAGASFEDAEDAVSEAMTMAAARFDRLKTPGAWVRVVAIRRYTRKRQRDQQREEKEQERARSAPAAHVDQYRDLYRLVRAILNELPPAQRMVMALTMDGYSCGEIAEMIRSPKETVRSNLRHARRAVAARLWRGGW